LLAPNQSRFPRVVNLAGKKPIEADRMLILVAVSAQLVHRPEARGAVEELELLLSSAKRMRASRWWTTRQRLSAYAWAANWHIWQGMLKILITPAPRPAKDFSSHNRGQRNLRHPTQVLPSLSTAPQTSRSGGCGGSCFLSPAKLTKEGGTDDATTFPKDYPVGAWAANWHIW
jgi:hypothetical protein